MFSKEGCSLLLLPQPLLLCHVCTTPAARTRTQSMSKVRQRQLEVHCSLETTDGTANRMQFKAAGTPYYNF
jgi:hypothetical protein